jgi:transposase
VADLDCFEFRTTVGLEVHRLDCVACGPKVERIEQVPSKAPYTKRFEDRVGQACESAAARRVARQFGLPESTVRAIDLRYLERWAAKRRKTPLKHMGWTKSTSTEVHLGKKTKFITVVSNLETGEPLWFGPERKKETLDEFFRTQLRPLQRRNIQAVCVDMWQPFTDSITESGRRGVGSSTTSFT